MNINTETTLAESVGKLGLCEAFETIKAVGQDIGQACWAFSADKQSIESLLEGQVCYPEKEWDVYWFAL